MRARVHVGARLPATVKTVTVRVLQLLIRLVQSVSPTQESLKHHNRDGCRVAVCVCVCVCVRGACVFEGVCEGGSM